MQSLLIDPEVIDDVWYTPPHIIEAARKCMGGIDLDPASSAIGNGNVKAERYFDADQDGLIQTWHGRVWLSPPHGRKFVHRFVKKLLSEDIEQAIVLTDNSTDTVYGQSLLKAASAVCFIAGRVRFIMFDRPPATPLQGQIICGIGTDVDRFAKAFRSIGGVFTILKRSGRTG